ncbi:hypothetical protein TNCT_394731 [Trichonephila clavata]|uniref:Uncharacterized protein n=1 Tax=Trichonephila clavata TaxID=2740835 RepID=A0A8X6EXB6_TRICU|nr:hypothetical protein TNCT_394731 [Trichonephila clavata]
MLVVQNLPDSEEEEELLDESKDGKDIQKDKYIRNVLYMSLYFSIKKTRPLLIFTAKRTLKRTEFIQNSNDMLIVQNLPDSEEEEELLDESKDGKDIQKDKNIRNNIYECMFKLRKLDDFPFVRQSEHIKG